MKTFLIRFLLFILFYLVTRYLLHTGELAACLYSFIAAWILETLLAELL